VYKRQDKAIELNPNAADTYYNRGNLKLDLHDYAGAIEDYTKAVELNSRHAEAYCSRGIARQRLRMLNEALFDYNRAIELKPDFADAFYHRGLLKNDRGDRDGGCDDLRTATRLGEPQANEAVSGLCR
jgi:tetratricopeptide (TPR) repeat protein